MGDKGGIRLQYGGDFTLYTVEHGALVKYTPELQTKNMFETEINSFVRCVRTGEKLPSHIDTAVLTSQIMQAIYDSAETHRKWCCKNNDAGQAKLTCPVCIGGTGICMIFLSA